MLSDKMRELYDYNEVFIFLGWRDVLVRYKQTVLGVLWVVLRPFLFVVVFTVIFSKIAGFESSRAPYVLLVFSGMLPWQFFSDAFSQGSTAFLTNSSLISKVYVPRLIIPSVSVISGLFDFSITLLVFILLAAFRYNIFPTIKLFFLPIALIWLVGFTISANVLFASLTAYYRDFKHLVPFIIQLGLYCTPVGLSSTFFSYKYRLLLSMNPIVGIIDLFRYILIGEDLFLVGMSISFGVTLLFIVLSHFYFNSVEDLLSDVL